MWQKEVYIVGKRFWQWKIFYKIDKSARKKKKKKLVGIIVVLWY